MEFGLLFCLGLIAVGIIVIKALDDSDRRKK